MNALETLGAFLLTITITAIISALLMVLQVHIVYDIADIYGLTLFAAIPVEAMYGFLFLIGFIRAKMPKEQKLKEKKISSAEILMKLMGRQVTMCSVYLIGWGLAGIFHAVIF